MVKALAIVPAVAAIMFGLAGPAAATAPERFIPMLETGDTIPPIPLIAQDARPFTLADFRGRALLISFIYTRCRDARMCPLVAAKFARLAQTIGDAPIHLLLITLDPSYDSPAVLRRYGRALGQDAQHLTLATGSQGTIDELATRLGIASATTAPGAIAHTEAAIVIGPNGRLAQTIDGNAWQPTDLIDAARGTLPGGKNAFVGVRIWLAASLERCGGGSVALSGGAILAVFALAFTAMGGAFRRAFRPHP